MSLRDIIPFAIHRAYMEFKTAISTIVMRFKLFYWHIYIGEKSKFIGIALINKHHTASINIGKHSVFCSSKDSNTIGIKQPCFLSAGREARISIGSNCGFSGTVVSACQSISIGDRVMFGANVTVTDGDRHSLNAVQRFMGDTGNTKPVIIEDDVWIGMNSIILKGVTIGKGAIIGANSVVNKSVPPNKIAAGVPIKILKNIA